MKTSPPAGVPLGSGGEVFRAAAAKHLALRVGGAEILRLRPQDDDGRWGVDAYSSRKRTSKASRKASPKRL
ncbi:MAG TPA: hypothetical protein VFI22_09165, partial [Thermomicrobiales bacterium]|nr:hypothetical protein [Thermomicrobiales bacterium]